LADESNGQLMTPEPIPGRDESVKQGRARLCESDRANRLLGTSFHPGGLKLTERLGTLLHLTPKSRVLDVASCKGGRSIFLAKRFRCHVVGLDYSSQNVTQATELAGANGLASRVRFDCGDVEHLPFPDASFDAVICECAFCTFPSKSNTTREFARVLRTGGRIGLSDFTRGEMLPRELDCLFALIACVADAQPIASYVEYLRSANFDVEKVEFHDAALTELVRQFRIKPSRAKNPVALEKLALPGVDFTSAKQMAQGVLTAVQQGQLGYVILVAVKPSLWYRG
jgi:arsenite methyltransferase